MFKRVFSLILALVLFLLPLMGGAGNVSAASAMADLEAIVEKQIRAFADSIDQKNADDDAAWEIAQHGMFGRGKKLSVGKSHPLTATIWNSELFQNALIDSCTEAVRTMQKTDLATLPNAHGTIGWYENGASYHLYTKLTPEGKEEDWDWELSYNTNYDGAFSSYDSSLCWIAGSTQWSLKMERTKVTKSEVTYRVTCSVYDDFDFNSEGHTPIKELMGSIGARLFKAFRWESTAGFDLKVPNSCTHSFGIYHWNYDPDSNSLVSDQSEGFTVDSAALQSYKDNAGGTRYYYTLENPVRLHHTKPWVVEYEARYPSVVFLEPLEKPNSVTNPSLYQFHNNLFFASKNHYYGLQLSELFQATYNEIYTYRLENRIAANGSNMVYLTVIEKKTDTIVVDNVPMDDYYKADTNTGNMLIQNDRSNWLNGKDFYINFIGNYGHYFALNYFDLRIWENGIEGGSGTYYKSKVTKPTCTAQGYTTYTCSCCGYSYQGDKVKAKGHNFGEWSVTTAATCTESGEEQRTCKTCKEVETRVVAAKDHSYGALVTAPTCLESGYTTFTCACGDSYVSDNTTPLGHNFEDRICTACGEAEFIPGDVDTNETVDVDDVLTLLWNVLFPEEYPIEVNADFDHNGTTDVDDVLALLWHVLFPDEYPL